jgi:putative chitinase
MLTALRGNSLYDTRFMMTDETSTKITLVKGQANLDCNQVCGSKKLNCAAYMLPIINKCNVLHEHFKCHLCQDHPFGYPTPTRNPGYENTTEQCFVSTVLGALSCEGNVENFERLCPCANRRKKKQFKLSPKLLRVAMPKTVDFEENSLKMGELLDLAKANTCHRAAALLAQVSYETEDLRYKFQLGNFDPLENRKDLENTETGDGERYKGRGYLQIAGKKNYREASKALGVDFVANPDLVASNAHGPKVAAWYWRKIGANKLADTTFKGSFREITNRLTGYKNTDPNHRDRRKIWINVQRALGCMVYGSNFM